MEQKITGLIRLRTAQKARLRAMPKQEGQEYLDMYLAQKRMQRHERERENLGFRGQFIEEDKKLLLQDMRRVQRKLSKELNADIAAMPDDEAGKPEAGKPAVRKKKKARSARSMKKVQMDY